MEWLLDRLISEPHNNHCQAARIAEVLLQGKLNRMLNHPSRQIRRGFTLIELLVVVLILGILTAIALPSYLSSVNASREGAANTNARALATAVQSHAIANNGYDSTLADYATDMGGAIPLNPCTASTTGYAITTTATTSSVSASTGTACGTWTPQTFSLTL